MRELYYATLYRLTNIYNYIQDYFYGHHDIWMFMTGYTLPLSLTNLNNTVKVDWVFNNHNSELNLLGSSSPVICKLSWLSAKIRIINSEDKAKYLEYTIDDFIEKFKLITDDDYVPTLYIIFMCWCIHTKHWFNIDSDIEFHIIDDNGEEQILNFADHNEALEIKRAKIYVVVHNDIVEPDTIMKLNPVLKEDEPLLKEDNDKQD
jgi:hypothetical protein